MTEISRSSEVLSSGWEFKQGDRSSRHEYLPANDLPTSIHLDLQRNEKIADPFKDLNELSVRWVGEESWTYRTSFRVPASHGKPGVRTVLVFEGLDTFAAIYLNRKLALTSDNMFVSHEIDITALDLKSSEELSLEIEFESARNKGLELVKEHTEHRFIVHQTEISRGPVRKAQYHWGWDWGPILLTCGPWKPIRLETYSARIKDAWVEYELYKDLTGVTGRVFFDVEGHERVRAQATISKDEKTLVYLDDFKQVEGRAEGILSASFEVSNVELWWPRGYGSQSLYHFNTTICVTDQPDSPIDQSEKAIGFRKVELIQEGDKHGTSFYFRINNTDIFSGGSCWIPADSFPSRTTSADYHSWLETAAQGNQIMVRVWGGGLYEDSAFFAAADSLGLLIWQDFAFACANYPAYPSYLESVEVEARQNVRRLRNHPSLVIWCGNNEDYQIVERYDLEYNYTEDKDPQSWLKTDFPARYIYEYLLPKIVSEETKGMTYHPSSPFGNGTSTTLKVDPTVGDIHQWNMWHGTMEPYQRLPRMGGRFVSEFGMEAYPHIETLEKCISNPEDRYPGSMAMDFRNKAIGHERRLVSYVAENFRIKYDLSGFTHLTQVMQADAMSWAYRSWRRDWGSSGHRKCGGVLVWQLNDCWPTMSWAVVDYFGVPKPAYYAIKRALEPITVNVQRKVVDWTVRPADELWQRDTSHIDMRRVWGDVELDVWVASARLEKVEGEVVVRFFSVRSGEEVVLCERKEVQVEANGTTEVLQKHTVKVPVAQDPNSPFDTVKADPFVAYASLIVDGVTIASDLSWPEPIKYLSFPDRGVTVDYSTDKSKATISAKRPVKGFVFSEKQGVKLSDNGFDIMPGETKEATVKGCSADELEWTYVEKL